MNVAVDISLYPLSDDWLEPIRDIIARLNAYDSLEIETNPMSTQIRGEYGAVMSALTQEMERTFEQLPKAVFTVRILNNPVIDHAT